MQYGHNSVIPYIYRLHWLFAASSAFFPSIYLSKTFLSPEERKEHIQGILNETVRILAKFPQKTLPAYVYTTYRYTDTKDFYSQVLKRILFLGHRSRRLQWPIVITRCPASVVRPSSVRQFTFSTSSPEPLDGFLMKLGMDEVLKVPYKCCCLSARSAQGRIQGGAKKGHGGPLLQKILLQTGKATATNQKHSSDLDAFWEKRLLLFVSFGSLIFDTFLISFWT